MGQVLIVETDGAVRTLTMNRPQQRNALNRELIERLAEELLKAEADDAVRVVVLTGTDPAFCAGFDLGELSSGVLDPMVVLDRERSPWHLLSTINVPVIGAVNGPAVTNGLALALRCSFMVASDRATFGDTNIHLGLHPGAGEVSLLSRAVGVRFATEMTLRGESDLLSAHEAATRGLVNHVVPHRRLGEVVAHLAADIARVPRPQSRAINRLTRQSAQVALASSLAMEEEGYRANPPDLKAVALKYRSAVAAQFREGRPNSLTTWPGSHV